MSMLGYFFFSPTGNTKNDKSGEKLEQITGKLKFVLIHTQLQVKLSLYPGHFLCNKKAFQHTQKNIFGVIHDGIRVNVCIH